MTNAERIRKMSEEELAEIIMCPYDIEPGLYNAEDGCIACRLEWLREGD